MTLPVTEFAILRLKPDATSLDDPDLKPGLRRVGIEQSAWSGFPLHWFSHTSTTSGDTFVCLLSQWTSVQAHQSWIDSAQNQALLQLLLPKLEIFAFCHIDLHTTTSEIQLADLFQAQRLSWRKLDLEDRVAKSNQAQRGDACGWAVDASEPTFYVFRGDVERVNVEGDESEVGEKETTRTGGDDTGSWTTMLRLDFENL